MGRPRNASDVELQKTRAWAGLLVVILGDAAIAIAAVWGVAGADGAQSAAILTSAFTAVSTMTTAYFGIRAATNTAQAHTAAQVDEAVARAGGAGAGQDRRDPPAERPAEGPAESEPSGP
ncbi:hypothetical protein [Streptomyces griseocarneus]|uniref:hypothetical protein n=1 Tax=Streptomyces griseocarneus TaxID=51201 RepID=UPI00167DB874|nr:hypothetical protein [Streptomyces griseocarneus]MBZ6477181.1 hypothetical protein [Streptomyces griseocarneus]GHG53944.1 hypothetical protein GCM10018779_16420 [Streptomyces griseocarneus]